MRIGSLKTMSVTPLAGITQGKCKLMGDLDLCICSQHPLFADCTWSLTTVSGLTGRRGLTQMSSGQRGVRLKSKAKKSQAKK